MNLPQNLFDGDINAQVILCQPDKTRIGEILPYDLKGTFKFNTYSEISLSIDRYYNDLFEGTTKVNPYYELIDSLRVIEIRGVGHFVIQDVDEEVADNESKSVTGFSLEYTTGQKYLENFYVNTGEEGSVETMYHAQKYGAEYSIDNYYTKVDKSVDKYDDYEKYFIKEYDEKGMSYNYVETQVLNEDHYNDYEFDLYVKKYPNVRFYWPTNPGLSLLHLVFSLIPEWKIGHVDKELWYQERTFSEDRTAIYDFLYNTAAETLNFVMVWDSISGTCSFYKTEEDGVTANTYVITNAYNPNFVYYSDANGTQAEPQPTEEEVKHGTFYINVGKSIETQWNTDVYISRENLASQIDIKYSTDDIKTKLKITGNDTLDIRDVNLGHNYILNLDFYNKPIWMGQDLYVKYSNYASLLEDKTDEYQKLMSEWAAVYNEYSDLMNHVPATPRVLLVGDEFKKLYCTYNNPESPLTDTETMEMLRLQDGGSVDLFNRPQISSYKLTEAGYKNAGNGTSTVFTITYSNEDETMAINVTPILPDGDVIRPDELESYASQLIHSEIKDYKELQIGSIFEGENAIEEAEQVAERIHELQEKYYLSPHLTEEQLVNTLKKKLGLYHVGVDDNGKISEIDKTDDVLLTLTNAQNDSATIRVRCTKAPKIEKDASYYINSNYKVCCTKTSASSGLSNTLEYSLEDWVNGVLTAETMGLLYTSDGTEMPFKVKSIGTLGAYLCLARDETKKEVVEDYGIRLLQEKQDTYTKIFITQTEGYMSKEGSRCVASNQKPTGGSVGDKWLDTNSNNAEIWVCTKIDSDGNMVWEQYSVNEVDSDGKLVNNSADFENYTRFIDNYEKLQVVQSVLKEKQHKANLLLDGIAYKEFYITENNITEENLLRAAVRHIVVSNDPYIISVPQPSSEYEVDGTIWFQLIDEAETIYRYLDGKWNPYTLEAFSKVKGMIASFHQPTEEGDVAYMTFTFKSDKDNEYAVYLSNNTPYVGYSRSQGLKLSKMNVIKEQTDMNTYFSPEELVRLSPFIREDEFSDSNFLLTGYESEEEEINIKQELLKAGKEELNKICQPKLSFDMTMANILSIPEFTPLKGQFRLGNFVKVEIRDGYVKRARLLEVQINFEDDSDFSCTFGDLISTKSEIDKHADLLQQAVTVSKSVAANQSNWQRGADKATELDRRINDGLQDATLEVGRANNQSIQIGQNGIWGRKLIDGTTDQYEPEQFRLINNKLVFSSDGFKTSKAVFGKYTINGETRWGPLAEYVTADTIEGKFISGGHMEIGGNKPGDRKFIVHEDGSVEIGVVTEVDGKQMIKSEYASVDALESVKNAYQYRIELSYEGSTIFNLAGQTCTVRCEVYKDKDKITSKMTAFDWYLNGVLYKTTTEPSITITNESFDGSTQLNCKVTFDEKIL